MDFVTHSLVGVSAARLIEGKRDRARVAGFASLLGSLLPDMDFWLILVSPEAFGRYHRTVTHSIIGFLFASLIAGTLGWWIAGRAWFGKLPLHYIIPGIEPKEVTGGKVKWLHCLLYATLGCVLHCCYDWVTGWGLTPLWPFSTKDFSLHAVGSFDWVIFSLTLAMWGYLHMTLKKYDRENLLRGRIAFVIYLVCVSIYVAICHVGGANSIW